VALRPSDRISRLPQQVFSGLIQEAQAARDAGHDVINLGQGNPDQPTPGPIVHTLAEHALDPAMQRYIPFSGLFALKEAVADWYHRRHQVEVDPQREVAICIGSKVGLQEISLAVLNAGDRVLMPDPGYPDYWSGVALAGGQLIPWRLRPEYNFTPDLGAIDSDVRLAFLNYPNKSFPA
jgi:aminotransferase